MVRIRYIPFLEKHLLLKESKDTSQNPSTSQLTHTYISNFKKDMYIERYVDSANAGAGLGSPTLFFWSGHSGQLVDRVLNPLPVNKFATSVANDRLKVFSNDKGKNGDAKADAEDAE